MPELREGAEPGGPRRAARGKRTGARENVLPIFVRMSRSGATQQQIAGELNAPGISTQRGTEWSGARVQAVWKEMEALHRAPLPLSTGLVAFGRRYASLAQVASAFRISPWSLQFQAAKRGGDIEAAILHFRPHASGAAPG